MNFRTAVIPLCAALTMAGCMRYTDVELIGVRDAGITELTPKGMSASISVEVNNPNNFRIQLTDPDVDLYINQVRLGKATFDSVLVLERNSTQLYEIPFHVAFAGSGNDLLPLLFTSFITGEAVLSAKGSVTGKAKALRKRVPFELEHRIAMD